MASSLPSLFATRFPQFETLDEMFKSAFGAISFDELLDDLVHDWNQINGAAGYPPYNILKTGDSEIQIEIAVAGFKKEDFTIHRKGQLLRVASTAPATQERMQDLAGIKSDENARNGARYIYKGLASRTFMLTFRLGLRDEVTETKFEDGLLKVTVKREPQQEESWKMLEVK